MLAIGRALMARPAAPPDEPSMGLAPMVIQQIFRIISEINSQGTTVLLVEQNAQQALSRSTAPTFSRQERSPTKARRGSFSTTRASAPLISALLDRDGTTEQPDAGFGRSGFVVLIVAAAALIVRDLVTTSSFMPRSTARQADPRGHRSSRPTRPAPATRSARRCRSPWPERSQGRIPKPASTSGDGVQLAIEKHNTANAGCQVQIKEFDTGGDPTRVNEFAPQIVADVYTVGLIGPTFSGVAEATGAFFEDNGLPAATATASRNTLSDRGGRRSSVRSPATKPRAERWPTSCNTSSATARCALSVTTARTATRWRKRPPPRWESARVPSVNGQFR